MLLPNIQITKKRFMKKLIKFLKAEMMTELNGKRITRNYTMHNFSNGLCFTFYFALP